MAKGPNQKLKLLCLARMLMEETDEQHPLTVAEMIDRLNTAGISAERKSIYDDMEALREFGLDVLTVKSKSTGYYIGGRDFELPELKLLVDSVQSSKFITQKKTEALIGKIEKLGGPGTAELLHRQMYVRNRVKSMNESIYYNVDEISSAIFADRQITFKYFEYTMGKERRLRHGGEDYQVSPYALLGDDENYYLLGWDEAAGKMKHYRVDKMLSIAVSDRPRVGREAFQRMDMATYTQKVFGMFGGEECRVTLQFTEKLISAVLDRFGVDVPVLPDKGKNTMTVTVSVVLSQQFYGWVFGLGPEMKILSPASARDGMLHSLQTVSGIYAEEEQ